MDSIYAPVQQVDNLQDCYFYQTTEIPGYGVMRGEWDLRAGIETYLGNVRFAGKRVLELGTASGFLCFEMEKRGAQIVAYDLSAEDSWDIVPYAGQPSQAIIESRRERIRQINNAWWLSHRLFKSSARMVYGSVYELPEEIGPVNITTVGSILLHLRDPFLALQKAAALTTETIIVTEAVPVLQRSPFYPLIRWLAKLDGRIATYLVPQLNFLPDPDKRAPWDTWWNLSPALVSRFLKILGFSEQRISYHQQPHHYGEDLQYTRKRALFTIVAHKTK